jgi:hypothetical protein
VVGAEVGIFADMVDDDGAATGADLIAESGLQRQLAAGFQSEIDLVADGAGGPGALRDPGHNRKTHAGSGTHHLQ